MSAPNSGLKLADTFSTHRDHYKSGGYNETEVRREFLDPLFKSLGWDIDNEQGYADAYKDVIHEDAIKIGGYTKAPDYCFRIGGQRRFFLEVKKPAIDNFRTMVPRKSAMNLTFRLSKDESVDQELDAAGLDTLEYTRWGAYRLKLAPGDPQKHHDLLLKLLKASYDNRE